MAPPQLFIWLFIRIPGRKLLVLVQSLTRFAPRDNARSIVCTLPPLGKPVLRSERFDSRQKTTTTTTDMEREGERLGSRPSPDRCDAMRWPTNKEARHTTPCTPWPDPRLTVSQPLSDALRPKPLLTPLPVQIPTDTRISILAIRAVAPKPYIATSAV